MSCLSGECSSCEVKLRRGGGNFHVIASEVTTPMQRIYWKIPSSRVQLKVEDSDSNGYMSFDDVRFHNGSSRSSRFCKGEFFFKQYNCKYLHLGPVHMSPVDRAGPVKRDLALPLFPLLKFRCIDMRAGPAEISVSATVISVDGAHMNTPARLAGMKVFQLRMTERSFSGLGGSILAYQPNLPFQKYTI